MGKIFRIHIVMVTLLIAIVSSCSDDESFTTDYNSRLSFSTDTVKFDTIFSTIGTSTKRLKVFNNNSKSIRILSTSLSSGGASGYRINVDGQFGPDVSNVEILKNDSIFIFIELTAEQQNNEYPQEIVDTILFTLESGLVQSVILDAKAQDIITMTGVVISTDSTITTTNCPYIIYDSLYVKAGCKLTIEEGVTLCFHKGAGLIVDGELECNGTLEKPITFRCDRTDNLLSYLPYDRTSAQWEGVHIKSGTGDCIFNYTDIHGGNYGVICDSVATGDRTITISNSIFSNVSGNALELNNITAEISNSEFSNAGENCVIITGGNVSLVHCTLAQFYPWDSHGSALYFTNTSNGGDVNLEKAEFINCVISGDSSDEMYGTKSENENTAFNYLFHNCFILTAEPDSEQSMYFENCVFESEENEAYRETNFTTVDDDIYVYDFSLTENSLARGIADSVYSALFPYDRLGNIRISTNISPDAGCYQSSF